jgi:CDP-diacylglycerol--serine O-phosphatidyltransferase
MFSGFTGVVFSWHGNLKAALLCLIFAGICDMFDGKIASTMKRTKQEKRFGVQIDSLSDLICFGALPALIVFAINRTSYLYAMVSATYLLCALIRLAWFNVDEEERQTKEDGARKTFLGMPVTTSAIGIPLFIGVGSLTNLPLNHVYPWLMLALGIAFLTPFRMKKPRLVGKLILITIGLGLIPLVLIGVPA